MAVVYSPCDAFRFNAEYKSRTISCLCQCFKQGIESVFLDEAQKVFQQIDVILPGAQDSPESQALPERRQHFQVFNGDAPLLERYDNPHRSTVDVPFGQKRPAVPVSQP